MPRAISRSYTHIQVTLDHAEKAQQDDQAAQESADRVDARLAKLTCLALTKIQKPELPQIRLAPKPRAWWRKLDWMWRQLRPSWHICFRNALLPLPASRPRRDAPKPPKVRLDDER